MNMPLRIALSGVLLAGLAFAASSGDASATGATVTPSLFSATISPEESESFAIAVDTGSSPVPALDVVFAIDRTASMDDEIEVMKLKSIEIMNGIRERIPDSEFGVVTFADYPGHFSYPGYENDYGLSTDSAYEVDAHITRDISTVSSAIEGISTGDGADDPEDYTRVLFEVMSAQWRPLTRKVVILFGDAATHDTDFAGYNFGGDPGRDATALTSDDLDFETVVSQLREELVSVLAVQGSMDEPHRTEAAATFMGMSIGFAGAAGTNGQYYLLDSADEIPAAIEEILGEEVRTIDVLALDIPAEYESWVAVDPATHEAVGPNTDVAFNVTIRVPSGTPAGGHSFLIRALGDGALLGSTSVEIIVPAETESDDLGFRADPDGYSFDNFSSTSTWEMFEQFFGTDVVRHSNGDEVYAAKTYYEGTYRRIGRFGSCVGFSANSLIDWQDLDQPNAGAFAQPLHDRLFSAALDDTFRNAIIYQQGTQLGHEFVALNRADREASSNSPTYYFNKIKEHIQNDSPAVLAIWDSESNGGHAIVPYRYEESEGAAQLYVYDNNHHGDDDRVVEFDLEADRWTYAFSTSRTWQGDSSGGRLAVIPVSVFLHNGIPLWNPGSIDGAAAVLGISGSATLEPDATDAHRIVPLFQEGPLPFDLYYVTGTDYDTTILGGEGAEPVNFSVFTGPSAATSEATSVDGRAGALVQLDTTAGDSTEDRVSVTPDGLSMTYASNDSEKSYSATVDLELADTSRAATIGDTTISRDETATFEMMPAGAFKYANNGGPKEYDLTLTQFGSGAGSFHRDNVAIGANETHFVRPADWNALGDTPVIIEIDEENDGTIDRKLTLFPGAASGGSGGGNPLLVVLFPLLGGVLTIGFLVWTFRSRRTSAWMAVLPGGRKVALRYGQNLIGRGPGTLVRINAPTVSQQHARIIVSRRGGVQIEDLGSENGTLLNGVPVRSARVADGDRLSLGGLEVSIHKKRE